MYDHLLENDGKILFHIYQQLLYDKQMDVDVLSDRIGVCTKYIKRVVNEWKFAGHHLAFGLDFIAYQHKIVMFITDRFSERNLFAFLLTKSSRFELLYILMKDPIVSMKSLENRVFIGRKTIRRRLEDISEFLDSYGLKVGRYHPHLIEGRESQKRLLLFHLEVLKNPKLITGSAENKLRLITKISNDRKNLGFHLKDEDMEGFDPDLMAQYFGYQLDEQGYLFTWSQLLGVEQFWFQPGFQRFVDEVLMEDELLQGCGEKLHQQIYRIHSFAALFQGDLLIQLTPHCLFDKKAQLIQRLCEESLPNYERIMASHPETPYAYQKIMNKKIFLDKYRAKLFEEPYLVKVKQARSR